jgi:hypothetical protein
MFPCYENPDAWDLDELVDSIERGYIIDFILATLPNKAKLTLGTLSMSVTKPVNGMTIYILVDLNEIERQVENNCEIEDWYIMRVDDDGDGFMAIKNDIESIQMVIEAIKNNTMPLHNVTKNIDPSLYPYIKIDS